LDGAAPHQKNAMTAKLPEAELTEAGILVGCVANLG
jgi:hypothetical protein